MITYSELGRKSIRHLFKSINEFKNGYQPRDILIKDESVTCLQTLTGTADRCEITLVHCQTDMQLTNLKRNRKYLLHTVSPRTQL